MLLRVREQCCKARKGLGCTLRMHVDELTIVQVLQQIELSLINLHIFLHIVSTRLLLWVLRLGRLKEPRAVKGGPFLPHQGADDVLGAADAPLQEREPGRDVRADEPDTPRCGGRVRLGMTESSTLKR